MLLLLLQRAKLYLVFVRKWHLLCRNVSLWKLLLLYLLKSRNSMMLNLKQLPLLLLLKFGARKPLPPPLVLLEHLSLIQKTKGKSLECLVQSWRLIKLTSYASTLLLKSFKRHFKS